jgi:putative restriction endonuclease
VYSALPVWLAWDAFGIGNGRTSLEEMQNRLDRIRRRIGYVAEADSAYIGCTMIVYPTFFPREDWVRQPSDWPVRTQTDKRYDLTSGEGRRIREECMARSTVRPEGAPLESAGTPRYGEPILVRPRLGQGTFRIAVTDAYARACAITGEHSLPVLDAGHIRPFSEGGPHDVSNGLLLRSDLHRLFDKGYLTVTADLHVEVSRRLRDEYQNGRSYYPLHGTRIRLPDDPRHRPKPELLRWHNENRFAA